MRYPLLNKFNDSYKAGASRERVQRPGLYGLLSVLIFGSVACSDQPPEVVTIDDSIKTSEASKSATSLVLWYDKPAQDWMSQALPIGNGRLAAMVFGGVDEEHIQFNEESLWEGGAGEWPAYEGGNRPDGHRYLPQVRELLNQGKFEKANELAQEKMSGQFLGEERSSDGYSYYKGFGAYQPFADIRVALVDQGEASEYRRELDLEQGIVNITYTARGIEHRRTVFASYPDRIISAQFSNTSERGQDYRIGLQSLHQHDIQWSEGRLRLVGALKRNGMKFEASLDIDAPGASLSFSDNALMVSGAKELQLTLAAATEYQAVAPHYKGRDFAADNQQVLDAVETLDFDTLLARHQEDYKGLFERMYLRLDGSDAALSNLTTEQRLQRYRSGAADPALEALFFQYGRYLLISASRPGSMPANLQGKWNDRLNPAWASDYHFNINIQMIYWPAEVTGLGELQQPLIEYMDRLREPGRKTAKQVFGSPGWVVNTMNNPFGYTAPGWGFPWGYFPGGAAWLSQHAWQHYAFSLDEQYLEQRAWPIMKEAAEFWLHYLQTNEQGELISSPSYSPEHGGISKGAAMDQQLAWDLFNNIGEACNVLQDHQSFCDQVAKAKSMLQGPRIGRWGQLQEWAEDRDDPDSKHRHVSQLFALYPGNQINLEATPALADAAKVSLVARGDGGTGWSIAWKINFWSRLHDGDKAHQLLRRLLRLTNEKSIKYGESGGGIYSNLLVAHPPFQLDGNEGGTAGMAEMLLQSHAGVIALLPALPTAWPDGEVKGLRARGGVQVDIIWRAGELVEARLLAQRTGSYRIRVGKTLSTVTLTAGQPYLYRL
ncbi:glycoside hydrolase family 95 protein [Pseudoteredinibacter isoporae]|nr:glycoside hydrolase family 95 protein [Pseudoteredinibacter isoporae]